MDQKSVAPHGRYLNFHRRLLVLAAGFWLAAWPAAAQINHGLTGRQDRGAVRTEREWESLTPGHPIEREISSGQSHSYQIALDAGKYLRVHVEQRGIDVTVALLTPDGKMVAESRSDNGNFGPETVSMIAEKPVEARLEIRAPDWEAPAGRYEAQITDLRPATEQDRKRVDAERVFAEGMRLLREETAESIRQSLAKFEAALDLYRSLDDRSGQAASYDEIHHVYYLTAETQKALDALNQALQLYQSLGDRSGEAVALDNIGDVYFQIGETQKALDHFDRALSISREAGDRMAESLALHNIGQVHALRGERQKALTYYDQALRSAQIVGLRRVEGIILNSVTVAYSSIGEKQKAIDNCNQALRIFREIRDLRGEAVALSNIGVIHSSLGEKLKALDYYERGLSLERATGERRGEASFLNSIGAIYDFLGEKQKALDYYQQSLLIRRDVRDRTGEAITLNNMGHLYNSAGENDKALDYFNQSLIIRREVGDRGGEGYSLNNIGRVYIALGENQKALETLSQSLVIRREVRDLENEGGTLNNIGMVYFRLGDNQKALDYYEKALQIRRAMNDRPGQGATLLNIGSVRLSLGEREAALEALDQSLRLSRTVGDREGEAGALKGTAQAERDRGDLTEALGKIEAALKIVESLRTKIDEGGLRASYLGATQSYYKFCIDLLMQLHRLDPSKDYAVAAFQTSERSRARALIETLAESRANIQNGIDPALLANERALQKRLESKTDRLIRLLGGKGGEEQVAAARKEIEDIEIEYQRLQSQIRAASPRYAALIQPQPLGLAEIRRQALDDGAILLEYALGEERSYLWAVTKTSITSHELPPGNEIEEAARRVRNLLTARNRIVRFEAVDEKQARIARADAEYPKAAAALSKMLLGPIAGELGKKRLLIVADGALQYTPFGALPAPVTEGQGDGATGRRGDAYSPPPSPRHVAPLSQNRPVAPSPRRPVVSTPLIVNHEIVTLPSASALAVLRRELAGRESAPKTVAVLADPVFERGDERLKSSIASRRAPPGTGQAVSAQPRSAPPALDSELRRSARDLDLSDEGFSLPRLPFTRKEARTILSLAPADQRFVAMDFAANQTAATSDNLAQYRYVHFATHGLLNPKHPELSGIVLSLFNEQGAEQDGFLRASEVYNLNLPAELVVLSGCQTGLGKDVRGEGLVGLTRGFMYAGAARVLVSLWEVDDEATSELMGRLYRGMLGKRRLTPAAALREAQISFWRD
ncbi:MAG TPA: tetratricopeptide repeat protein, partial [Blastocatellia bacterium]|nr:tetratricopeptide repeat protein [Blastocatellia bacterium]